MCLGRSPSMIAREIVRNGGRVAYRGAAADHRPYQRARRPKPAELARNARLRALVEEKLTTCWSPEQIAGWLRRQFPGEESMRVDYEAIYLTLSDWTRSRQPPPARAPKRPAHDGRPAVGRRRCKDCLSGSRSITPPPMSSWSTTFTGCRSGARM
ncbi:transposase [Nocardia abscessus]|uniref:transposase n=1 Tax=Nocardia abscessus TaxID=120957 RepID=UPI003CC7DC1E